MITYEDQIAAVRRELARRERVYPRFVANKQMTKAKADYELEVMRAVLKTLLDASGERGALARVAGLFD
jgi:hypothetical protein